MQNSDCIISDLVSPQLLYIGCKRVLNIGWQNQSNEYLMVYHISLASITENECAVRSDPNQPRTI